MDETLRQLRSYFEKTRDNLIGKTVYVADKKTLLIYTVVIDQVVIGYDDFELGYFIRFDSHSSLVQSVGVSEQEIQQGCQGAGKNHTVHFTREEAKNELRDTLHGWRRQVENL